MGRGLRRAAAGLSAGVMVGAAWVAAPLLSIARRGTVDEQAVEGWRDAVAPAAPAVVDPRIERARRRAALVASIPAPRPPHATEQDGAPGVPPARRSPGREAEAAD